MVIREGTAPGADAPRIRSHQPGRARPGRTLVASIALVAAAALAVSSADPASAYWNGGGSGTGGSTSGTLQPPTAVLVAPTSGPDVAVGWTASAGAPAPTGYYVTRTSAGASADVCGSSSSALLTGSSCVDAGVADGSYSYTVTAVYRTWTARSVESGTVVVRFVSDGPDLGAASSFSVLGGTGVANTLATTISGDLGLSPSGAVAGFPPGIVAGDIHALDAQAASAQLASKAAYDDAKARLATTEFAGDLVGRTFFPGVYHSAAALLLTGILTLDGGGDPHALFVIQIDAAMSPAAGSTVALVNGATAANVFWQVNGAVSTGANSAIPGTILAEGAITLGAGSVLIGRAFSRGIVTLANNTIRFTDALPPTITVTGGANAVTKDTTPTIAGSTDAVAGSRVTVTVAGQTLSTTVLADHSWSVTATDLLAASYSVVVKVTDVAGNGAVAAQSLLVEVNPPPLTLGAAATYSVLAGTTVTNSGVTTVTGNLGVSPGIGVAGDPVVVGGAVHTGDEAAVAAQAALLAALTDAATRLPHTEFTGDLNGRTFHAGVHHTAAALALTGILTLDAEGDPNAVFIFRVSAALNTAASSSVLLVNGAKASNVFWVVDGAAGTGGASSFAGTILAQGAITLGLGTQLVGAALSRGGVTLAGNSITGITP